MTSYFTFWPNFSSVVSHFTLLFPILLGVGCVVAFHSVRWLDEIKNDQTNFDEYGACE